MTDEVTILDKTFTIYISADQIQARVNDIADKINHSHKNKNTLFLGILNGSFIFASDLLKKISIDCEISFIKLASYFGTTSSGKMNTLIGLNESLAGKDIIIVEDIIDSSACGKNSVLITAKRPIDAINTIVAKIVTIVL